jgi:RHS repeat-associated protein
MDNSQGVNGNSWLIPAERRAFSAGPGHLMIVGGVDTSLWFSKVGDEWVANYGTVERLKGDPFDNNFMLIDPLTGTQEVFMGLGAGKMAGRLLEIRSPGGTTSHILRTTAGNISSFKVGSGQHSFEYVYQYNVQDQLWKVTQKVDDVPVRRAVYTYHQGSDHGSMGDLKLVEVETWKNESWVNLTTRYYRYYIDQAGGTGFRHGLQFVVGPEAWERLEAAQIDPENASAEELHAYADNYFEYDSQRRVTREIVAGGSREYAFEYDRSYSVNHDPNQWFYKTTEKRPDGTDIVVYSNHLYQVLFKIWKNGGDEFYEAKWYDLHYRRVWLASSEAVDDYDEALPHPAVLKDYEGRIEVNGWYNGPDKEAPGNFLESFSLKKGVLGQPVAQNHYDYFTLWDGGADKSSFIVLLKHDTVYRSDADGGSEPATTSYNYDFFDNTAQISRKTTTLPEVDAEENGDDTPSVTIQAYDIFGRPTWSRDELGSITLREYDIVTGALARQVEDVDSTEETDSPWTTPDGGGLNLVTDYQSDLLGRRILELGPEHVIDLGGTPTPVRTARYTVYKDEQFEEWSATGYAVVDDQHPLDPAHYTYVTLDPVAIVRRDADGRVTDRITSRRDGTGRLDPSDEFPQEDWLSWTATAYDDQFYKFRERAYHLIPTDPQDQHYPEGLEGTNYNETRFGYDSLGTENRTVSPGGTITRKVFNPRKQVLEVWTGTDDTGATDTDPGNGGAGGNNMKAVLENEYDHGSPGGNGLLTKETRPVSDSVNRITEYGYDWRDRRTEVKGEENTFTKTAYDNRDNVILVEKFNPLPDPDILLAKRGFHFDALNRRYRELLHGVDGNGNPTHALQAGTWRDAKGRVVKTSSFGNRAWTKTLYDGADRPKKSFLCYRTSGEDTTPGSVDGNIVIEQSETDYDDASNVTATRRLLRFPGETATGELTAATARIYHSFEWSDGAGRPIASANYGTALPDPVPVLIPPSTDESLVSRTAYNAAGLVSETTDPQGTVTSTCYDALGRPVETIENRKASGTANDENKTTLYEYAPDGMLEKLTVKNHVTGDQVTVWEYGTTLSGSAIATSTLLRKKIYPGSTGGSDEVEYTYNRQGQAITQKDQRGTVHTYDHDLLGRLVHDRVTTPGTGVDPTVRRISTTWNARGQRHKVTSYDHHAPLSGGSVVNEVEFLYDDFGNLKEDRQSITGPVTTGTLKVAYLHADGSANTLRLKKTTYPNGREVENQYGAPDSADDMLSRLASIQIVGETPKVAEYEYLGAATAVESFYPQPGVKLTYFQGGGDSGDDWSGLDRFGRIADHRWIKTGTTPADIERTEYGYTRASLKQWRKNAVAATGQDEYYNYDGLYQVKKRQLGTLNSGKTGIDSPTEVEDFTYDPSGNWQNYQNATAGSAPINQNRTHDEVNEITSFAGLTAPVAYDPSGNMTKVPFHPYASSSHYQLVWDAWNRLVRVTGPAGGGSGSGGSGSGGYALDISYRYDGLFRRTRKIVHDTGGLRGMESQLYYWNRQWKCVESRQSATVLRNQYLYGGRGRNDLVLRDRSAGGTPVRHYALCDAMGSKVAITSISGTVVERYRYSAFGKLTVLTGTFGSRDASHYNWTTHFHGEERDPETGWYNYGYRYYLPELGRWPSRDLIGEEDGLNLYSYIANDGINDADYLGLCKENATKVDDSEIKVMTTSDAMGWKPMQKAAKKARRRLRLSLDDGWAVAVKVEWSKCVCRKFLFFSWNSWKKQVPLERKDDGPYPSRAAAQSEGERMVQEIKDSL